MQLDAGDSTDPDDGISAYRWNQVSGPAVILSDPQAGHPDLYDAGCRAREGASLTFQLTVIDYSGLQSQDACIVNVTWQNFPPEADAGVDQEATSGDVVTLDGNGSMDSDDGISSYRWKQIGGTAVTLKDTSAATTTFTAPDVTADTTLEFELTVTDGGGLQSVDRCSVLVHAGSSPALDTTSAVCHDHRSGSRFRDHAQVQDHPCAASPRTTRMSSAWSGRTTAAAADKPPAPPRGKLSI